MTEDRFAADRLTTRCRETLRAWHAPNDDQERLRRTYLEHLDTREAGWARSSAGAHLTASSLVCAGKSRQVLLTLHSRIGRWLQTGGHIEATDLDLEHAAGREAVEESGLFELVVDDNPLLLSRHEVACGPLSPTFHLDVQFLIRVPHALSPILSEESTDVRWFGLDELPDVDSSVRDLVRAAADRLGW
ncbi:MAG: hypothetical protein JWN06_3948 [Propionibacteriaceae bacterium]|nr:hypothetical protein [Propionibacteriaceae bacterium]